MNAIRWLFIETIEIRKANNLSSSDSYASIFILSLSLSLVSFCDYRYDHYVRDCLDNRACLVLFLLFKHISTSLSLMLIGPLLSFSLDILLVLLDQILKFGHRLKKRKRIEEEKKSSNINYKLD
jgi:hypothetical protein